MYEVFRYKKFLETPKGALTSFFCETKSFRHLLLYPLYGFCARQMGSADLELYSAGYI